MRCGIKRVTALLLVTLFVAFFVFAETTPHAYPTADQSFDPSSTGSSNIRLSITPTSIPPQFAIYGGVDNSYGSIGSSTGTISAFDENAINVITVDNSIQEDDVNVMVKVVQYNSAHCTGSYTVSLTAYPIYLDGEVTDDESKKSYYPTVLNSAITPSVPFNLDVDSDGVVDFVINSHTITGSTVSFSVTYPNGMPVPPVYEVDGERKEVIIGAFTYCWACQPELVEGGYVGKIVLTYTVEN